jgi:oligopeptide transport system permease protein
MGRYIARRLLQLIPVFFGSTFLIYVLVWAIPADPLAGKCGDRPCPQAYRAVMEAQFHLHDSIFVQYFYYIKGVLLHFDLGSDYNGVSIKSKLLATYPTTVKLALVALVIEAVIGVTAGVLAGLRRGRFLDNLVLVATLALLALPVFVTGFLLQYYVGVKARFLPVTVSAGAPLGDLIMPGVVLGSLSMAFIARLTRSSVAENRHSDYIRTAIAKGQPMHRVYGVHLLRNSLIPVITFLGTDLGSLMAGAIITEGIFSINGIGRMVYRAIALKESFTVVSTVTVLVIVYLLANLLVDILYAVLDPRIRYG